MREREVGAKFCEYLNTQEEEKDDSLKIPLKEIRQNKTGQFYTVSLAEGMPVPASP
jgi:hypothetical protein